MPLPSFNAQGDLPEGKHSATLSEVIARFGTGSDQRVASTAALARIHELATSTGNLDRILVFASFVSDTARPNDVDVILVMRDGFQPEDVAPECSVLFDHARTDEELGASVFWIRPEMLLGEPLDQFLSFWQTKRDGRRRGVVEILS